MTLLRIAGSLFSRLARWWLATPSWLRWAAVGAIIGVVWWLSTRSPGHGEPDVGGELAHNSMHLVAFGALAAAAWFACGATGRVATVVPLMIAVTYGCIDEFHQSFVPGRTSSVGDVVTDTCGAIVALWALRAWYSVRRPRWLEAVVLTLACATSVVLATFVW